MKNEKIEYEPYPYQSIYEYNKNVGQQLKDAVEHIIISNSYNAY